MDTTTDRNSSEMVRELEEREDMQRRGKGERREEREERRKKRGESKEQRGER